MDNPATVPNQQGEITLEVQTSSETFYVYGSLPMYGDSVHLEIEFYAI
jgi:hypothetical protein